MVQNLELEKMGLVALSTDESFSTDGGKGIWDAVVGWAVGKLLDNADKIALGYLAFSRGAGDVPSNWK